MPPVYEALLLNTVVPQIQAAQTGDSYVMVVNATTPALRITQTGTGDSILVEDSANPDSSPFVVTAAGDVGIGTSTPAGVLSIKTSNGQFLVQNGTSAAQMRISAFNNAGNANAALIFEGYTSEYGRFDTSGNLGLGVTPSNWNANNKVFQLTNNASLFSRSGLTGVAQNFRYNASDTGIFMSAGYATLYYQNAGSHVWTVSTTSWSGTGSDTASLSQAMTLDASGRQLVGLTTTQSNNARLQVKRTDATVGASTYSIGWLQNATGYEDGLDVKVTDGTTILAADYAGTNHGTALVLSTNSGASPFGATERARITSGGNLLVGTQTDSGARCTIDAASATNAVNIALPSYDYFGISIHNKATSNDNSFIAFGTEASFTARGSITYNRAGGLVAYNTTSDYRAKDVTGPVANSGATIDALKVYNGKMKGATVERPMLIAHEAQEVTPYAVTGEKDAVDEDGKPKYQQMDVSSLVPLLIAELQSLRARVAQLEQGA